jgi:ATP-dependent DNA helicase DinG
VTNHKDYIEAMFADHTGALARTVPGYQRRESQVTLAKAIADAIDGEKVLFGEAPTGTGKSMAYLVPAIMHAIRANKPVCVVTANKALQEQLIDKDLPTLRAAFQRLDPKYTFGYALLKGRSNYLCRSELKLYEDTGALPGLDLNGDQLDQVLALSAWSVTTETGDQADAPGAISPRIWGAFSVSSDRCSRSSCPHRSTCFAEKAVAAASSAEVVVVNYDLFFHKVKNEPEGLWEKFGTVIFDEAHDAANIARRCLGDDVNVHKFSEIATDIGKYFQDRQLARALRSAAGAFFDAIARYAIETQTPRVPQGALGDDTYTADELREVLDKVHARGSQHCSTCANEGCGVCSHWRLIANRAAKLADVVYQFTADQDGMTAYWIERPEHIDRTTGDNVKIRAVPYRVGPHLAKIAGFYPSLIAVSATLTTGGTFDYVREEYGMTDTATWQTGAVGTPAPVWTLRTASPFNFAKQAKLIVPLGVPWPIPENEDVFNDAAVRAIEQLVHDCKGRTMALFTSKRRLKYVADRIKINYPLLIQGDMPNKQLAQMFREDTHSVLLATKSFWTGLDIQGESLSCLIIDKLPLESFSDPLVDMMKTRHPDAFWDAFYFPRAAIELAQGAGRLIRSTSDRGVFVLLDSRIIGKRYGGMMLRSLPFVGLSKNLADAGKFLAQP